MYYDCTAVNPFLPTPAACSFIHFFFFFSFSSFSFTSSLFLLPLAISSPASSSLDRIFGVPSNADYKPSGFMLIPGIGPRKKRARRHTMFFFRLFATPIFFAHQRTVGLLRDPDKSNSHEQIQDEYW